MHRSKKKSHVEDPPDGQDQPLLSSADDFSLIDSSVVVSNSPAPAPVEESASAEGQRQAESAPSTVEAGWYPDESQPGMLHYWDGNHWTGQSARVPATPMADAHTSDQPVMPLESQAPPPSIGDMNLAGPVVDDAVPDAGSAGLVEVAADATANGHGGEGSQPVVEVDSPVRGGDGESTLKWIDETQRAIARARVGGTPEAWRDAAQAAVVVSEMAQTMQKAATAKQAAESMSEAAQAAVHRARAAVQAAADAEQIAQQAAQAAHDAAQAAEVAARSASEAKRAARQATQEAPSLAESAKVAAHAAADAGRKAQLLDGIVAKALAVNTHEAWNEAVQLALSSEEVIGLDQTDEEQESPASS
jgi:hypothetical protein